MPLKQTIHQIKKSKKIRQNEKHTAAKSKAAQIRQQNISFGPAAQMLFHPALRWTRTFPTFLFLRQKGFKFYLSPNGDSCGSPGAEDRIQNVLFFREIIEAR